MVKTSYISCACNRLPHTADWGRNNLVCYAANHAVAIYDPKAKNFGSVLSTLHVHTDRVNVVRWIRPTYPKLETEFISASSDGTAVIWNLIDVEKNSYKASDILRVNEPTNICDAIYFTSSKSDLLICTGSINGDFRFWLRVGDQEIEPTQILNFSKKLPIGARLALLPNKSDGSPNPLLLLALEDSSILLYSSLNTNHDDSNQKKIGDFVKVQVLVGHEDWVTSMDYLLMDSENLLIASGSQDNTIRLWKISTCVSDKKEEESDSEEVKPKKQNFFIHDQEYEIILESILSGHDAWIYEVHWHPLIEKDGKQIQPMMLLSCSLDKTAIIWKPSSSAGIWSEAVRVGEVGGNSLGFYGCKFAPNGKSIFTHGYHGSFHMWEFNETTKNWEPRAGPSGHYDGVTDLSWDPKGRFLLSASADQTTRVHAPWSTKTGESWHEIGRPQIHGYDMSCLAILKPYMFASGAEEKVIRIFTAPLTFKKYLEKISNDVDDFDSSAMAEQASVPALGLTNKATLEDDLNSEQEQIVTTDINYNVPPVEEELLRHTLWPELQKLYGHGYEIFSMAARHNGTLLATASKSMSSEHAAIILWNTKTWSQTQKLLSHKLTVTQIAFSPDDKYLLSVSRDRRWSLFILKNENYELLVSSSKKDSLHTRIIWCCAWTNDAKYFATGSRDGKVGIWSVANIEANAEAVTPVTDLYKSDTSITAIAFAPFDTQDKFLYILAIGYESGCIDVRKIHQTDNQEYVWDTIAFLNSSNAHHLTVKRLVFRPKHKQQKNNLLQLASCGLDSMVKIYDIVLD